MYRHQNGRKVDKATKATVVAAIWKKAGIYAHFVEHVDSDVCKIRTLYDSYSLLELNWLKRINVFIDSNKAWNELSDISQKDVMN